MRDLIDDLRHREITAAEAGDVEGLLELRTDGFVAMPPNNPPVRGKEEVAAFLRGMFSAVSVEETVTSESVVVDGDLAYDRGTFSGRATKVSSGASIPLDGKYLWIAVRESDGAWRYAVQMWSDNSSPDE